MESVPLEVHGAFPAQVPVLGFEHHVVADELPMSTILGVTWLTTVGV